ncbi:hypothetical protein [Stappia sp. TSB10GB4]|uniref:hypothetical protein n=1 Tax=Stappia sp. TSB10GB4 TaxID=2003584 RepID=UPI00164562B0|nr:hypothetical protein [Stappia sp. TSB10GB4]
MPPEPTAHPASQPPPETAPARETDGPAATVAKLAAAMLRLDPGELARLRRMEVDGPGEPEFWKLAVGCGLQGEPRDLRLVRLLALLAPKGARATRVPFHKSGTEHALGRALHKAGLSEARLARFLALPRGGRADALERLVRLLAARGASAAGIDCTDIARLVWFDTPRDLRKLAETYYRGLDAAAINAKDTAR